MRVNPWFREGVAMIFMAIGIWGECLPRKGAGTGRFWQSHDLRNYNVNTKMSREEWSCNLNFLDLPGALAVRDGAIVKAICR